MSYVTRFMLLRALFLTELDNIAREKGERRELQKKKIEKKKKLDQKVIKCCF